MRNFDISNDRLGLLYGISAAEPEQNLAALPRRARTQPDEPVHASEKKHSHDALDHDDIDVVKAKDGKSSRRRETDEDSKSRHRSRRRDDSRERSSKRHSHRPKDDDRHKHRHHSSSSRTKLKEKDYLEKGFTKPPTHPPDDPAEYDDTYLPNAQSFKFSDPDAAFRASLFDAMADDEGATFWEGVYGQRVDNYPRPEVQGPQGELEQLDDDEYAAYVREKMYEKTHEYIFEERARREKARQESKKKKAEERERWEEMERERVEREVSRRRRKARDRMKKRWEDYTDAWARIVVNKREEAGEPRLTPIPWPVESGSLKDIALETVKDFYFAAKPTSDTDGLYDLLKSERVKWHPDKIQQRWGQLEDDILRGVNTTFQIIDNLWVGVRDKKEKLEKLEK
ncbi:hypothetical protein DFH27DRAFT_564189 [Peziza echinospora]|nr:hypothetical protein DFH27DRAFT_564189 [Peziza echinospora]